MMTARFAEVSPPRAARIAGIGYLTLFFVSIFANFFVLERLIEPGDASATAANIAESEGLFRIGIVGFLVIVFLDVAIAWLLYIVFRRVHRDISLVAAWFRLVYAVFLGFALTFLFVALQLLSGVESGQNQGQVMWFLDAFNYGWLLGLAFFGIHLVLLGYLMIKSVFMPKVIGILLVLAGAAYMIDTLANTLLANYSDYETLFLLIVAIPAIVAELAFTIWLLLRAGKEPDAMA